MVNEKFAADADLEPSALVPPPAHEALVQRLNDAGYKVLETRPGERGLVWTLEPLHSRVEFQIVGQQELLRFLDHH